MTNREFLFAVANMREAQRDYFRTRDSAILRAAIAAEREVDEEILRRKEAILAAERDALCLTCALKDGCAYITQETCPRRILIAMGEEA